MWGREMRAGLFFVIVMLLVGQGFREWKRGHEERFQDLVEELEDRDARARVRPEARPDSESASFARGRVPARGDARVSREVPVGRIDPNRASASELERLPGIGPSLAGRIVQDRDRRGAFPSAESLQRVPGIGPKILGRIRAYLTFPDASGGDSLPRF